ncbi:MAG: hypothetical protein ABL308_08740 [Oceanicaulis sp.]
MKNILAFIGLIAVVAGGAYFYAANEGGGDPCAARAEMFADQVPPALDIVAAEYPLRVGVVRNMLNDGGRLDDMLRDEAAGLIGGEDATALECAYGYYGIWLFRDQVRQDIADEIEASLGLGR